MEQERLFLNREAKILMVQIASNGYATRAQIQQLEKILNVRTLRIEFVDSKEDLEKLQALKMEMGIEDDNNITNSYRDISEIPSYKLLTKEVPDIKDDEDVPFNNGDSEWETTWSMNIFVGLSIRCKTKNLRWTPDHLPDAKTSYLKGMLNLPTYSVIVMREVSSYG